MRTMISIVCSVGLIVGSLGAQNIKRSGSLTRAQTHFSAENRVKSPTEIPRSILKRIRREFDDMPGRGEFMRQLEGSLVFLNNDRAPELLVQGPLGANITTFRLYRKIHGKWHEVLKAGAHDLLIEKGTMNGFHNIATAGMTAVKLFETTYKFKGRRYVAKTCSEETIGLPKTRKYFRCSN